MFFRLNVLFKLILFINIALYVCFHFKVMLIGFGLAFYLLSPLISVEKEMEQVALGEMKNPEKNEVPIAPRVLNVCVSVSS